MGNESSDCSVSTESLRVSIVRVVGPVWSVTQMVSPFIFHEPGRSLSIIPFECHFAGDSSIYFTVSPFADNFARIIVCFCVSLFVGFRVAAAETSCEKR